MKKKKKKKKKESDVIKASKLIIKLIYSFPHNVVTRRLIAFVYQLYWAQSLRAE